MASQKTRITSKFISIAPIVKSDDGSKYRSPRAKPSSEREEFETGLVNARDEIVFGHRDSFREAVSARKRYLNVCLLPEKSSASI